MEPIAIVGRGCVLPGALSPAALADLVAAGASAIAPASTARWALPPGRVTGAAGRAADAAASDRGGFVSGFDAVFDAGACGLDAAEIAAADPQLRWLLHAGYEALREAGLDPGEHRPRAGAIVGNLSYPTRGLGRWCTARWLLGSGGEAWRRLAAAADLDAPPQARFCSGLPVARMATGLGLGGGWLALDAACASSLYALRYACDRLAHGEADLMLAGAVNATDPLFLSVGFTSLAALSPSGRSRPFHREADGLVPAEGAVVLALRRHADARRDGQRVLGLLRGVGLANDGRRGGLLSPARAGQVDAMRRALAAAGVEPAAVDYIECHATGTALGDRVEIDSTAEVYAGARRRPLAVGSLKANLGHLITSSGAAGLLKVLAAMQRGALPATPGIDRPTEALAAAGLDLVTQAREWPGDRPRLAAVSSFGFGGNDAHAIVEEAPREDADPGAAFRVASPAPRGRADEVGDGAAAVEARGETLVVLGIGTRSGDARGAGEAGDSAAAVEARGETLAVLGIGIRSGDARGADAVAGSLLRGGGDLGQFARSVTLDAARLPAPPRDLERALAQQLLVLEAGLDAVATTGTDPARSAVLIGMGCETAAARNGARLRMGWWLDRLADPACADEAWRQRAIEAWGGPVDSAAVLGAMPNMPANLLGRLLDARGPCHTVSAEENSGLAALALARRLLADGEVDRAIVGAVDSAGGEPHAAALRALLPADRQRAADGAVVLVLCRAADVEAGEDIALLDEFAWAGTCAGAGERRDDTGGGQPEPSRDGDRSGVGERPALRQADEPSGERPVPRQADESFSERPALRLDARHAGAAACFGHVHAAAGLLLVAGAALGLRHGARFRPGRAAQPLPPAARERGLLVSSEDLGGGRHALRVRAGGEPRGSWPQPRALRCYAAADMPALARRLAEDRPGGEGACRLALVLAPQAIDEARRRAGEALAAGRVPGGEGVHFSSRRAAGEAAFVFNGAAAADVPAIAELVLALPVLADRVRADFPALDAWLARLDAAEPAGLSPYEQLAASAVMCQLHARWCELLGFAPAAVLGISSGETNALFAIGAWRDMAGLLDAVGESGLYTDALGGRFAAAQAHWSAHHGWPAGRRPDISCWRLRGDVDAVRAAAQGEPLAELTIVNSPRDCVLGGEREACERIIAGLDLIALPLGHDLVVHCAAAGPFAQTWRALHDRPTGDVAGVRYYSNASAAPVALERAAVADALTAQAMAPVDFRASVEAAWKDGVRIFVELGPRALASGWVGEILGEREHRALAFDRAGASALAALDTAAELWCLGLADGLPGCAGLLRASPLAAPGRPLRFALPAPDVALPQLPAADEAGAAALMPLPPPLPPPPTSPSPLPRSPLPTPGLAAPPATALAAQREAGHGRVDVFAAHHAFIDTMATAHAAWLRAAGGGAPRAGAARGARPARALPAGGRVAASPRVATGPRTSAVAQPAAAPGAGPHARPPSRNGARALAPLDAPAGAPDRAADAAAGICIAVADAAAGVPVAVADAAAGVPVAVADAAAGVPVAVADAAAGVPVAVADAAAGVPVAVADAAAGVPVAAADAAAGVPAAAADAAAGVPVAAADAAAGVPAAVADAAADARDEAVGASDAAAADRYPVTRRPPSGPRFGREQLEVHARGRISELFGAGFAAQDGFRRQVRMPAPPLLLADRVVGLDAAPGSMRTGCVWTETEVADDAWYLHAGRMPAGLMVEAGQADLFLISWLGIDLHNRGRRVYRLLGCELTLHGPLVRPGETLRFEIHVDGHARQGDVRLFFFHYDCFVGDALRMKVREGQAGFFSDEELEASQGVMWTPAPLAELPARHDPPPIADAPAALDRARLEAFASGDALACFGPGFELAAAHLRTPAIAGGRMLLLDRVTRIDHAGGVWGRGYLRAEADVRADAWFFDGHFHEDPCMPGTLMLDAAMSAAAIYIAASGHTLAHDGWRFEPESGRSYRLVCRGQVTPRARRIVYEVHVRALHGGARPVLRCDLLGSVDGLAAFHCADLALALVPDWPPHAASPPPGREPAGRCGDIHGDRRALLACTGGPPSEAFGKMLAAFDERGRVPRLPGPPYLCVSRVLRMPGAPATRRAGGEVEAELDWEQVAWAPAETDSRSLPWCVLVETALQPCGWLAVFTLGGDHGPGVDLRFRNLDGTCTVHREPEAGDGPIRTVARLTRFVTLAATTIVEFDVECTQGDARVLDMNTRFGFFPHEAMAGQTGLGDDAEMAALAAAPGNVDIDLRDGESGYFEGPCRLPRGRLRMLDRVSRIDTEDGRHRLRAELAVDPRAWYFKAHFYQDPVQPGTLGLEAMLQLLQVHLRREGLDRGFRQPRLVSPTTGAELRWSYRGQVDPRDRSVSVTAIVRHTQRDADGVRLLADASLWVDGLRIYHAEGLALAIVESETAPGGGAGGPRDEERLDAAVDRWIADHSPTWVRPTLPITFAAERLAAACAAARPGLRVTGLDEVRARRWLMLDEPTVLRVETGDPAAADAAGVGAVTATARLLSRPARAGAPPFSVAFEGEVRLAPQWPAAPAPPPRPHGLEPRPLPYTTAALFHGPAFQLLKRWWVGEGVALGELEPAPGAVPVGAIHPLLLDAALQCLPRHELHLWDDAVAPGSFAYPSRLLALRLHGPAPRGGEVWCLAELDRAGTAARTLRTRYRVVADGRLWAELLVEERCAPVIGAGADRLAVADFARARRFVPGIGLARERGGEGESVLERRELLRHDWLPGTVAACYGAGGDAGALAREVAVRDHVARRWRLHPAWLSFDAARAQVSCARRPFARLGVSVEDAGAEVRVRDDGGRGEDFRPAVDAARRWLQRDHVPAEDLLLGLLEAFVGEVSVDDPQAMAALHGRPAVYLANHQTGIESMLFLPLLLALQGRPVIALAKEEHRRSWLGDLAAHMLSFPDFAGPASMAWFERDRPETLARVLTELRARLAEGHSLLVHVEGTRAVAARQPVAHLSGALLDFAIAAGASVVPVRFSGGLPLEPLAERTEFPVGLGRQGVHLGVPIAPAALSGLTLKERVSLVLGAINGCGPPLAEERPAAADSALERDALAWQRRAGCAWPWAVLACLLARAGAVSGDAPPEQVGDGRRAQRLRGDVAAWHRGWAARLGQG